MTNAAFVGTVEDKSYLPHIKHMFNGLTTYVCLNPLKMLIQLEHFCKKNSVTKVVCTNTDLLTELLQLQGNPNDPTLKDYAGSLFSHKDLEIVFISPLKQIFSVRHGKFLCERFISKIAAGNTWPESTAFSFSLLKSDKDFESSYNEFYSAYAIAIDIETFKSPLSIRCISYTGVFIDSVTGKITTKSIVFPIDSSYNLEWMRKFNELPAQKIFQNGKYDNSYLLRYAAPVRNWLWDTAHLFHSWYSEMPKDLAFLNAFFLRKVVYWKDLAETPDLYEYYKYNALDSWATANVWIQQLRSMPDWAKRNYTLEFPLVFPCLLSEMTGVKRNAEKHLEKRKEIDTKVVALNKKLQKSLGQPAFNANSHVQVKTLLKVLGCGDITSSEEKELQKAAFRHPLISYFTELVLDIRGLRKLTGTYLRLDEDAKQTGIHAGEGGAKEFNGFWLYALQPHGTDSARLSSGEHAFWCGANIQNVPIRDGTTVRETIEAPPGFLFGECDLEQAESRDTGYIAGEEKLIAAVSGEKDFHSLNAAAMSGKKYEDIYDDLKKKTKNKPLRDIFKRVNHGANYNMTAPVLVTTMGLKDIFEAKKLLGLKESDPIQIAQNLLERFHVRYAGLKGKDFPFSPGTYYAKITEEVVLTKLIRSRAFHHTDFNLTNFDAKKYIEKGDWTRYCFGQPSKSKPDLNAYVSHPPQSLNARTLNEAYMLVFYNVALKHPNTFRLHAQIHDSILFSFAEGHKHHADEVKKYMEIPVTVRDVFGTYRTFTVPAALKLGKDGAGAKFWSETE